MNLNCPKCGTGTDAAKIPNDDLNWKAECSTCQQNFSSGKSGLKPADTDKPPAFRHVRRIIVRPDGASNNADHHNKIIVPDTKCNAGSRDENLPTENPAENNERITSIQSWRGKVAAVVGAIIVAGGGLLIGSDTLSVSPSIAGLYKLAGINVNSPSLRFEAVTTRRDQLTEGNVLIVEGTIKNISNDPVRVPAVRLQTRGATKANLSGWTYEPEQIKLKAGNSMKFSTRLYGPPDNVQDILLEFTTRSKPPKVAG